MTDSVDSPGPDDHAATLPHTTTSSTSSTVAAGTANSCTKSQQHLAVASHLERKLATRPEAGELIARNVMKGIGIVVACCGGCGGHDDRCGFK
jgi:hypothetical protein